MTIKAIETTYKGYRFRSRLEARWAVYLSGLGVEFQYEPDGFELAPGEWYLPDFYLSASQLYVEIKPSHTPLDDIEKAKDKTRKLAAVTDCNTCVVTDGKRDVEYGYFDIVHASFLPARSKKLQLHEVSGIDLALRPLCLTTKSERIWTPSMVHVANLCREDCPNPNAVWVPRMNDYDAVFMTWPDDYSDYMYNVFGIGDLCEAAVKAKSARFEHGETPK